MSRRGLEWGRALSIWCVSLGLYVWLGGQSLQFLWWLCTAMLVNGVLLSILGPSGMDVQRSIAPACLYAGEDTEVKVTITFKSWMPVPWIMMTDQIGEFTVRKLWFPGFRRAVRYTYTLHDLTRGNWPTIDTNVEWGDMFGWFRSSKEVVSTGGLMVLPRPLSLRGMLDLPYGPEGESETVPKPVPAALPGHGMRDYISGDPLNRIHWKNSARIGRLQTFLPQPGRNADRCIILDTSLNGYPEGIGSKTDTSFETAVAASAGLLYSSAVTLGKPSLWIGGAGRSFVRSGRTGGKDEHDMLIPLASVTSQPGNISAADILECAAADEDHATELLVVTGRISHTLADSAIHILASGRKVSIYCTSPLPGKSGKPNSLVELGPNYSDGLELPNYSEERAEDQFLRAGGRLLYISGGDVYEITNVRGGGEDGEFQQLIR